MELLVFESTLKFDHPHALLWMNSVPWGNTSELPVLMAYLSSLANSLSHCSGVKIKDKGPHRSKDNPTLWWVLGGAVAFDLLGLTLLKLNLYLMSKLGCQSTTGAPVVSAWYRASTPWVGLATFSCNLASITWRLRGMRNAGSLPLPGINLGTGSHIFLATPRQGIASVLFSWKGRSGSWLKCHRHLLWLLKFRFSWINVSLFAVNT